MADPKTDNDFMIGGNGQQLQPMLPPVFTNKQQAYRFAAWSILLASTLPDDPEDDSSFGEIYEAIERT